MCSTTWNPSTIHLLPSISNIAKVYKNSCEEDTIIIAQSEIAYLYDISLEGDIPDNVLDIADNPYKALFTGNNVS
jgi:hypothetical protein